MYTVLAPPVILLWRFCKKTLALVNFNNVIEKDQIKSSSSHVAWDQQKRKWLIESEKKKSNEIVLKTKNIYWMTPSYYRKLDVETNSLGLQNLIVLMTQSKYYTRNNLWTVSTNSCIVTANTDTNSGALLHKCYCFRVNIWWDPRTVSFVTRLYRINGTKTSKLIRGITPIGKLERELCNLAKSWSEYSNNHLNLAWCSANSLWNIPFTLFMMFCSTSNGTSQGACFQYFLTSFVVWTAQTSGAQYRPPTEINQ